MDPQTRAARTLVEADYRMKLVGMGLEEGVPGVRSYMSLIKSPPKEMSTLRWWFTLNYDSIQTSQDHLAFNIRGQGVKVESENEHLTAQGERVHTGESEPLNRQFTESFTKHFDELCAKYPIYAELRNLCDLALAASLVREEGLADKVDWHMAYFGNPQAFVVEQGAAPKEVDSVVNYRLLNQGRVCRAGQRRRGSEDQRVGQPASDPGRELSAASGEAAQQRRETAGGRPLVVGLSFGVR